MKKYRLIKKYPGSPELGETRTGSDENCRCYPTEKCMENNPQFWEEVVEKDYEILEMKNVGGNIYTLEKGETLGKWGLNNHTIHSIKRLSDGEIFTVGDKLKEGVITNIIIKKDKIYLEI